MPDATADVTIDALDTIGVYAVTIAAGESEIINSLTLNASNNLAGTNSNPYTGAQFQMDGTLTFAPGSAGLIDGSLQTYMVSDNGTFVNVGTFAPFFQGTGNVLFTGTNGFYVENWLQSLGTVTVDTKSIGEITGATPTIVAGSTIAPNTLFDGIYDATGANSVMNLGGALENLIVNIATLEGPPAYPTGWAELILAGQNAQINEWNGTAYVSLETTLTEIGRAGTVDVMSGRDYTTTNTLTIDSLGMLNLQAGTITTAGLDINGGVVQGIGTIANTVTNDGTLMVLAGTVGSTMTLAGSLIGTGVVEFDHDLKNGGTLSTIGGTLDVASVSAGQTIIMNGSDTLVLTAPSAFAGSISAEIGDSIILQGVTATSAIDTNGTLFVSNGTVPVAALKLSGSYANDSFTTNGSIITIGSASAVSNFTVTDTTTGMTTTTAGSPYTGPVSGITSQYITATSDSLNITATTPNSFIHTGSGTDAIDVSLVNGTNVLDGSTGSNFLVGGTGFDTFFLDDRGATADTFSTVVNFHAGDDATVWGITTADFTLNTYDNQGAAGYTGLDFSFTAAGKPNANLVLTGYTTADLTNGSLTITYGTTAAVGSTPGSTYMLIHHN
ncbi:MAG TPA: hypothetical protein DDZ81_02015 [Acetobacteraceae bacterium]|nr:hypothetical protein [Acetobacteraceae bacterium]